MSLCDVWLLGVTPGTRQRLRTESIGTPPSGGSFRLDFVGVKATWRDHREGEAILGDLGEALWRRIGTGGRYVG